MVPEILIVGDPSRRRELIDKVRECHYDVTLCAARELNRRIRTGPSPGAIIVSTADVDATLLLAGLRRSRQGAAVPVILFGRLGGEIRDLADVLDLGADHFLEDPIDGEGLRDALLELAGPASGRTETQIDVDVAPQPRRAEAATDRRRGERTRRGLGMVTERLDEGSSTGTRVRDDASESTSRGRDPMLGQLHKTLDRLEARLRDRDDDVELHDDDHGDIDLSAMGLDDIPDLDGEVSPGDSASNLSLEESAVIDEEVDEATDVGFVDEPRSARTRSPRPERFRRGTRPEERSAVLRGRRPERDIPPREESRRVSARSRRPSTPRAGSIEEVEIPRLLWRLHSERFSGRVQLQRGRAQKQVWLAEGEVVFVRSNLSSDRLVDGLLRRGVLTRPQYETARRLAAKQPSRAGRLLVEAGFVKPRELHRLLQDHLTRVLDETFAWSDGSWVLEPGETIDERVVVDTPMPVMILEGIRIRVETAELRQRLGRRVVCPRLATGRNSFSDALANIADTLRVLPEEERWLARFDGKHGLDELIAEAGGDEHALLALVYALYVLEMAELLGEPEHEAGGADGEQVDANRIEDRLRLAREADYFALLGVPRDASRAEVRRAYTELAATFGEDTLEANTRERFGRELGELRSALEEARDVLSDDAIRSAYLAHLGEP